MNSIFGITVTPFQRSGGIYVAAIFTAQKEKKKKHHKIIHWKNVLCKKALFFI